MRIALVAALARNGIIGKGNALPWHLPADLRHFRRLTLGKPVLMGRRTYESIGHPLPERINIVVSRTPNYRAPGSIVVSSLEDGIEAGIAMAGDCEELMVIGGAALYRAALPLAERLYLTRIEAEVEGDVRFVDYEEAEWEEVAREEHPADARNPFPYRFVTLQRKIPSLRRFWAPESEGFTR